MELLLAHLRAQDVFSGVLVGVKAHQLDGPTPCSEWTVRDLIEHVIWGNERVLVRAGLRAEAPVAVIRPEDLVTAHRASAAAAQEVFAAPDGMSTMFQLPIGPVPGSAFIGMRTIDALVHGWDLAAATGQSTDLDPGLAARMLALSRQGVTGAMRGTYFGEPQPCDQDRPPADQLAAFLGRALG